MSSIFELTAQQKELEKLVESGELTQEDAADTFEGMAGELNDKINDYCKVRNKMIRESEMIQAEIDRLSDLKTRKDNQVNNITNNLRVGLENIGQKKFDTGMFNGYFRKGRTSLSVIDKSKIPDEYVVVSVSETVDKTLLKKDIESGAVKCDGVELVTGDYSLIIK